MRYTIGVLLLAFGLLVQSGCQTVSQRDERVSGGARLLTQEELASQWSGNTVRDIDNGWAVFYAENGEKLAKVGDDTRVRRWWINDAGEFCETLYRTNKEFCGPQTYLNGDVYTSFDSRGAIRFEFKRESGNTLNP